MTLEQAKSLKPGQVLYHAVNKGSDGKPIKWRVNGKVKTWKRNPNRVYVPVKHGLYCYGHITENEIHLLNTEP